MRALYFRLDALVYLAHLKIMQLPHFFQWTKSVKPALLFGGVLFAGCSDVEKDDLEMRDQDLTETGDSMVDDEDEPDAPKQKGGQNQPDIIPGQYIVMLKKGADPLAAAADVQAKPKHTFKSAISGFSGPLNDGQLQALSQHEDVVRIEPDRVVTAAALQCPTLHPDPKTQYKTGSPDYAPAYSVDRIDQLALPFSNTYSYTWSGKGVDVYIVDTWLMTSHPDFGGRARVGYDGYPNDPSNGETCSGHATHVAGLVGGTKYGVAKDATLISVEVLDCSGHGSWSKLLAGIDWIIENKGSRPAVANMSLAGSESLIVDWAIDDLAASGVFVVVAAGNDNKNACNYSPAGAASAMTVAASNTLDQRASFSNHGSCVDIYAGGTNVRSAWPTGGSRPGSGTSMAAPHVAGVAALYKHAFGNVPWKQVEQDLESWALRDKISSNVGKTPNLLVHWPCTN